MKFRAKYEISANMATLYTFVIKLRIYLRIWRKNVSKNFKAFTDKNFPGMLLSYNRAKQINTIDIKNVSESWLKGMIIMSEF